MLPLESGFHHSVIKSGGSCLPVLPGSFSQLPVLMYFGACSGPQSVTRLHEDTYIRIPKNTFDDLLFKVT